MNVGTTDVLTVVFMGIGVLMFFSSLFFRIPSAPREVIWNPRKWTPMWKMKDNFRRPGFQLLTAGYVLFAVAFIARVLLIGWGKW